MAAFFLTDSQFAKGKPQFASQLNKLGYPGVASTLTKKDGQILAVLLGLPLAEAINQDPGQNPFADFNINSSTTAPQLEAILLADLKQTIIQGINQSQGK